MGCCLVMAIVVEADNNILTSITAHLSVLSSVLSQNIYRGQQGYRSNYMRDNTLANTLNLPQSYENPQTIDNTGNDNIQNEEKSKLVIPLPNKESKRYETNNNLGKTEVPYSSFGVNQNRRPLLGIDNNRQNQANPIIGYTEGVLLPQNNIYNQNFNRETYTQSQQPNRLDINVNGLNNRNTILQTDSPNFSFDTTQTQLESQRRKNWPSVVQPAFNNKFNDQKTVNSNLAITKFGLNLLRVSICILKKCLFYINTD